MLQPWTKPRFPASVMYVRFDWQSVEPEDGRFDWTLIDTAIAEAHKLHQTVAMRVMTANAHSTGYYSSPKWLFEEGCKGYEYGKSGSDSALGGSPITRIEPDYSDPIYLAKHAAFMEAFGARYNGSPDVEFLDIGSYGVWGEWHTTHPASVEVRRQIVDMYLRAFSKTPLVFMTDDGMQKGGGAMSYALEHGTGLRRDGVGSPWHAERWAGTPAFASVPSMGDAWKHAPVVFEWYGSYEYLKSRGWSLDAAIKFMLDNHVTLINDNIGDVPPEAMPKMEELARRAGYRFVLRQITQPRTVTSGEPLTVMMTWANVGVGKLYRDYQLRLGLREASGAIVVSAAITADLRDWLPGEYAVTGSLPILATLKPGTYTLVVALMDAAGQRPPLRLAMDAPSVEGWYAIGELSIDESDKKLQ